MGSIISPSQTIGPMWGYALMFEGSEEMVESGTPGARVLEGQLTDGGGPVVWPLAMIELWSGDAFARGRTDDKGYFRFLIAKPQCEPTGSGKRPAPYLNVGIFAQGLLNHLMTRMYFPDEQEANADDPVLQLVPVSQRGTLIAQETEGGLRLDLCLQGDKETAFFAH